MGKKRAVSVRRIGETLTKLYPSSFASNFEENKRIINEMMQFPSKAARNKVAGFTTRVFKLSAAGITQKDLQLGEPLDEEKVNET